MLRDSREPEDLAGSRSVPQSTLYSGPFSEDWIERCLSLIEWCAAGETPLVLLPTDIQLEDYAPHHSVFYGDAAEAAFAEMIAVLLVRTGPRCSSISRRMPCPVMMASSDYSLVPCLSGAEIALSPSWHLIQRPSQGHYSASTTASDLSRRLPVW